MSSKEQTHSNDKESMKQRLPKPATENSYSQVQQQAHPAAIIRRAGLDPRSLSPSKVLQLQRTIGNQTVGRLLAGTSQENRSLIQRKQGDPEKGIAEAEYATLAKGKTIKYTKLAAGCMAVTAYFSEGGGAGYHFAMMVDNAAQWGEFVSQIGGKTLSKLQIDSDMVGEKEGWWVRYQINDLEMFDYGDPITTQGPMSYATLKATLKTDTEIFNAGWVFDKEKLAAWFEKRFGVAPTLATTQSPGPYSF